MYFTVPSCKRRLALAAVILSALVLAGCAVHHSETTCTTDRPVTVLSRMSETPLVCDDLGVTTTLSEMRDAGWRVVTLSIGADTESEKHVGFPVTVIVRKLF